MLLSLVTPNTEQVDRVVTMLFPQHPPGTCLKNLKQSQFLPRKVSQRKERKEITYFRNFETKHMAYITLFDGLSDPSIIASQRQSVLGLCGGFLFTG